MSNLTLQEQLESLKSEIFVDIKKERHENKFENKIYKEDKTKDKIVHNNNIINKDVVVSNTKIKTNNIICKRGEIFYSDLDGNKGSEQGGTRPVLIIQNDIGNRYSPTVIVAVLTSRINKVKLPTHIEIDAEHLGLPKDSIILFEQIRTLDKRRLKQKIGMLDELTMKKADKALSTSLALLNTEVQLVKIIEEKTLLENLPEEQRKYIINKIRFIERAKESIEFYKSINADNYSINFAEDEKFREENALQSYCDYNNIDYHKIYNDYLKLTRKEDKFVAI